MARCSSSPMRTLCLLVAALLVASAAAAGARSLLDIPQACVDIGGTLQADCSTDLAKAVKFFGSDTSPDDAKVQQYTTDPANKVSDACCKTSKAFNDAGCNDNPDVVQVAASYTGGDTSVYKRVAEAVKNSCGF